MSGRINLPPNHRRSLSATAQLVENALDELESVLGRQGREKLTSRVKVTYSNEDRDRFLRTVAAMRLANEELVRDFGLDQKESTEKQIVQSSTAYLWTILRNSTSRGMRGFGELPPDSAREVDRRINQLLNLLEQFFDSDRP